MSQFFKTIVTVESPREVTPQKYEIPEKHRGYKVPADINAFVKDILPNIYHAMKRTPHDEKEFVVGRFIIRMFQVTKSGKKRYEAYNPEKYSTIPYYKWFLSQLFYFELYHYNAKAKEKSTHASLSFINSKGIVEDMQIVRVEDPFDVAYTRQLPDYLKQYCKSHSREETSQQRYFENYAYDLYQARLNGLQNQEFAAKVGVSGVTVSQWMSKLRILVENYFRGSYQVINTI